MKGFVGLLSTAALGAANDNFFKSALVMLITFKGMQVWGLEPKSVIALAGGIFILPYFLFSGIAGEMGDSLERSSIMKKTKYWELLIMAMGVLCFYLEAYGFLLIVLFCMGAQSTFFSPAKYSSIMDLSSEDSFVKANAQMEMTTFVAILLGTIGGGLAAKTGSYTIISAVILVMAGLGIFTSFKIPELKALLPDLKWSFNPITPSIRIIKDSFKSKDIYYSILGASWFWFVGACLLSIMPIFAKELLHSNEAVATAFLACFTVGIGLGSLACERLSFRNVELGLTLIGAIGIGVFMLDLSILDTSAFQNTNELLNLESFFATKNSVRIFSDLVLTSLFLGMFVVPFNAWMQMVGENMRSRVVACNNIINAISMVISAVFLMFLYSLELDVKQIFAILAYCNFAVCLALFLFYPKIITRFWIFLSSRFHKERNQITDIKAIEQPLVFLKITSKKDLPKALLNAPNMDRAFYKLDFLEDSKKLESLLKRSGFENWPNSKKLNLMPDRKSAKNLFLYQNENDKNDMLSAIKDQNISEDQIYL
ncbi:MAG: MFS transporter [Bdellovibrionota bacterium]|nr:MFS transporter [Bdellovibrionota bacterium]